MACEESSGSPTQTPTLELRGGTRALVAKACDPDLYARWRTEVTAPVGTNQHVGTDNVSTLKPKHGNTGAYTLARLREQRPDLFERVVTKELSAHAAAIEAGWCQGPP